MLQLCSSQGWEGTDSAWSPLLWQERRGLVVSAVPDPYSSRPSHSLTIKHFAFLHPNLSCGAPNPAHAICPPPHTHKSAQQHPVQGITHPKVLSSFSGSEESPGDHGLPCAAGAPGAAQLRDTAGHSIQPALLCQDQIGTILNSEFLH